MSDTVLTKRFEKAFNSSNSVEALRSLILELSTEGYSKAVILEKFEHQRQRMRAAKRESDEDAIMDAMDFLIGWCSPHKKLDINENVSRKTIKTNGETIKYF